MSMEPMFEIGVDYDGVDIRHHQVNEVRNFNNSKIDRIFFPECGAFYTDSAIIRDINTGKELVRGEDYDAIILDPVATSKSGKEVCGVIVITNNDVAGISWDYQFVGGIHATGYYILEQLLKMYPEGASSNGSYYDLINVPDEHNPAYHTQHIHEFFNTDELLVWLERIRQAIIARHEADLIKLYDHAQAEMDNLYSELDSSYDRIKDDIADTLSQISIQSDEYILTDSSANPAISRGYGIWQLVTNRILYGVDGTMSIIGSGGSIMTGTEQIIRNCYIWKNIENSTATDNEVTVTSNVDVINEGGSIIFTINAPNVANNTKMAWAITNLGDNYFSTAVTGIATITGGKATVTVTAAKDYKTTGDRNHTFYLTEYAGARKDFTVLDTTLTSTISNIRFVNSSGTEITSVAEDEKFRLQIISTGGFGKTVYLHWVFGAGLSHSDFKGNLPTTTVIQGVDTYVEVETTGNMVANAERLLTARLTEYPDQTITTETPRADVNIRDTSQEFKGSVTFLNEDNLLITNSDEGVPFKIRFTAVGGAGKNVKFEYQTNKNLSEFSGLLNNGTVDQSSQVLIEVMHNADYLTRTEPEFLKVKVLDGTKLITEATLMFNDTSKTPRFQVMFSKKPDGSEPVTVVNEGDIFYSVIQVPGWIGATSPPVLNLRYGFTGKPSRDVRVTTPSGTESLKFSAENNKNDIQWLNNNTIAIKHTANALKALNGDATFSLDWKMERSSDYTVGPVVTILNTSVPTLNATWSSSPTTLTPVTSVNEMTSTGDSNLVYLWINVDGDASTFDNLTLSIGAGSVANAADLITVFPSALTIATGVNKHIVTVEINNDFITEGNEKLEIVARASNLTDPAFVTSITIIDNSVLTSFKITPSTSSTAIVSPESGLFSEWVPNYLIIEHDSIAFDTTADMTNNRKSYIANWVDTVTIKANTTKTVIELTRFGAGRHTQGVITHNITAVRKHNGKAMTAIASTTMPYDNDMQPPELINQRVTTDVDGKNVVTAIEEGKTYYAHFDVTDPFADSKQVIGVIDDYHADPEFGASSSARLNFPNHRKVLTKATVIDGTTISSSTSFTVKADRKTNAPVTKLALGFVAVWNVAVPANVGDSYGDSLTVATSVRLAKVLTLDLVDASKTPNYPDVVFKTNTGVVATSFNEGSAVQIHVTIENGTIGDSYTLSNDLVRGNAALARFSFHEFDSKTVTITNNVSQTFVFNATINNNEVTDGATTGYVKLNNVTTGSSVNLGGSYAIIDTSRTTTATYRWLNTSGAVVTSINEGDTVDLEVTFTDINRATTATLNYVAGGRPLTDFTSHEFNTAKTISGGKVLFRLVSKANYSTDALIDVNGNVTINNNITNFALPVKLTINDTSKNTEVSYFYSSDAAGNTPITRNFVEGEVVYFQFRGANLPTGTTYNWAMNATHADFTPTSGTATPNSSGSFSIAITVKSAQLSVAPAGAVKSMEITLTNNLTSATIATGRRYVDRDTNGPDMVITFHAPADINTVITSANEGDTVVAKITTNNYYPSVAGTWSVNSALVNGIELYSPTSGSFTTNSSFYALVNITINKDYTAAAKKLTLTANCDGATATGNLTVNDTSKRPVIDNVYWSSNPEGTNSLTSVKNDDVVYLIIKTTNLEQTSAKELSVSFPNSTLSSSELTEGSITGTILLDIGTYTSSTGVGHTYYKLKIAPSAVQPTPNNTYHWQSNVTDFVLAAGATKYLTIVSGIYAGWDSDWDGASSGITGVVMPVDDGSSPIFRSFTGGYQATPDPTNYKAIVTKYGDGNWHRNNGNTPDPGPTLHGYTDWGSGLIDPTTKNGVSYTKDGITITIISTVAGNYGRETMKVKITNNNASAWTGKFIYGTRGWIRTDYDDHGYTGSTFYNTTNNTVSDTSPVVTTTRNFLQAEDGYIIVSDS